MSVSQSPIRSSRWWLVCVSVSLILGCATTTQQVDMAEPSVSASLSETSDSAPLEDALATAAETSTQGLTLEASTVGAPDSALTDNPGKEAIAKPLFEKEKDAVDIKLATDSRGEVLQIGANGKIDDYKVFKLTSPDRLVIDLSGVEARGSRQVETNDSAMISRVRLGSHGAATRLVVDLKDTNIQSNVETREGSVLVSLARESSDQPALITGVAAPELPGPSADASGHAGPTSLTGLSIEPNIGGEGNAIVAELSNSAEYSLKQTAPSEYVLRVRGASIDEGASTTVLSQAPGYIRSVRPVAQGDDLILRIFAKPESTLHAQGEGNKIVVSSSLGAMNSAEVRAQMAPEATPAPQGTAAAPSKPVEIKDETTGKPLLTASAEDDDVARFLDDSPRYTGRLISLDLQDTDIDNALRIIAEVSNLNIIASDDVTGKVTLRLIDVPWDQALDVILKTNNLDKVQEGNVIRIAPVEKLRAEREALKQAQQAEEELEPLQVRYIRVSYARASELKPLIDNVVTERGAVTFDERTNQVIVKDIARGLKNVAQLVAKLDLRTPQVLLETQIVEANRGLLRDIGTDLNFTYIQSPETGNGTGKDFPSSIITSGTLPNVAPDANNIVSMIFSSSDGTKRISARIAAAETEGRARVISRPAIATTNNKQAVIKSVEKLRIRLPNGGVSVATGQGANASGQGQLATETIEVGIVLQVTPQASPDYYVLLDVNAKSSNLGPVRGSDGIPSEIERSASSTVLVSSGQTFALGGIYKISDNDSNRGMPFLKDVPFFGALFRDVRVNNTDEELLFFITPRIVEGSFDDATMKASS